MKTYFIFRLNLVVVMMSFLAMSCAVAQRGEVIVPGGLNSKKTNNLWNVAKNECYKLGYIVVNDDRSSGNLVCQKEVDKTIYNIRVYFTDTGFTVNSKSNDLINPVPGMRAQSMEDALRKAAGL